MKPAVPEEIKPQEIEKAKEIKEEAVQKEEEAVEKKEMPTVAPSSVVAQVLHPAKSESLIQIEKILEEDLGEIYLKMTPSERLAFKAKGEETATKIEQLLKKAKVAGRKILKLIIAWLKLIPGVNKFFLEQEAKIKVDRLFREKK